MTVVFGQDDIADVTVPPVTNHFDQSAQFSPQEILNANGLGALKPVNGIQTGQGCLLTRATDVSMNMDPQVMQPQASGSIFGECFGRLTQAAAMPITQPAAQVRAIIPQPELQATNTYNQDLALNRRAFEIRMG